MFDYGILQSLTVALSEKLEELFENPIIYHDMLPMGYEAPCFFINAVDTQVSRQLYDRYKLQVNYDVTYHPEEKKFHNAEFSKVGNILAFGLETVNLEDGKPLRGNNIGYEVQDNVLHFFVTFDFFVRRVKDRGEKMMILTQIYTTKE